MDRSPRGRRLLVPIALIAQLLSVPLFAHEAIKARLDFNDVRVVVRYVSTGELMQLQNKHGEHLDLRELRQNYRHGFSILKINRETGVMTCEIYLPNDQRPREVDDIGTLTLGHELLHCMLGTYHR